MRLRIKYYLVRRQSDNPQKILSRKFTHKKLDFHVFKIVSNKFEFETNNKNEKNEKINSYTRNSIIYRLCWSI